MNFDMVAMESAKVFAGDDRLTVEFYPNAQLNEAKTEANGGVPVYEDKVFVKIYVPGDQYNVIDQPAWIDERHPNAHNKRFPKQWAAFKANASQLEDGTPLAEFPALVESQRKTLAFLNIRTVEQLAKLADDHCQKVAGGQDLKRKASAFLEMKEGTASTLKMADDLAKRDAEAQRLRSEMAELQATVAEMKKKQPEVKK